jgi:hypothetical protein
VAKQEHSKIIRADIEMVPSTFEPSAGISEEVMRPTKEVVNILFSHFDL